MKDSSGWEVAFLRVDAQLLPGVAVCQVVVELLEGLLQAGPGRKLMPRRYDQLLASGGCLQKVVVFFNVMFHHLAVKLS